MAISLKQFVDFIHTIEKSSFSIQDIEIWTHLSQIHAAIANDPVLKTASTLMYFDPWRYPGFYQKCYLPHQHEGLSSPQKQVLDTIFACFLQNSIAKCMALYEKEKSTLPYLWSNIQIDALLIKERKIHEYLLKIKKGKTLGGKTLEYMLNLVLFHYEKQTTGLGKSRYLLFLKKASENPVFQEILSSAFSDKNKYVIDLTLIFFCDKEYLLYTNLKNSGQNSVNDYICALLCPPFFDRQSLQKPLFTEWDEIQLFLNQWHYHSISRSAEPAHPVEDTSLITHSTAITFVSHDYIFTSSAEMLDLLTAITSHFCVDRLHSHDYPHACASPLPLNAPQLLKIQDQLRAYCTKIKELEKKLIHQQIGSYKKVFFYLYQFDTESMFSKDELDNLVSEQMNCCGNDDFQRYIIEAKIAKKNQEIEQILDHVLAYQYDIFFPKSFLFIIGKLFESETINAQAQKNRSDFFYRLVESLRQSTPYGLESFSSRYFLLRCKAIWCALAQETDLQEAKTLFESHLINTILIHFKDYLYLIEKTTKWSQNGIAFCINARNYENQDLIQRLILHSSYDILSKIVLTFTEHFSDITIFENIQKMLKMPKNIAKPFKILINQFPQVVNLVDSHSHTLLYYALLAEHDTALKILYTYHAHHQKVWLNSFDELQSLKTNLNRQTIPRWHDLLHERPTEHAINFSSPLEDGKNLYQIYVDSKQYFAIETMVQWIEDGFGYYSDQIEHPIFYAIEKGDAHAVKVISPLYSSPLITSQNGLTPFEYCIYLNKPEMLDCINEHVHRFQSNSFRVKKNMMYLASCKSNTACLDWMLEKIAENQKDPFSLIEPWVNLYNSFGLIYACFFFIRLIFIVFAAQKNQTKNRILPPSSHYNGNTGFPNGLSPSPSTRPPALFRRISSSSFPVPEEHSDESELAFIFRSAQNSIDETYREEEASTIHASSEREQRPRHRSDLDL